jgi:hypothetical protein
MQFRQIISVWNYMYLNFIRLFQKIVDRWRILIVSYPKFVNTVNSYKFSTKLNTEPSIHVDASYPISVHMVKQFQRRNFFRNRPIRNKNCMGWPCLLIDRDEMSNVHRGHSIDASYQVSKKLKSKICQSTTGKF